MRISRNETLMEHARVVAKRATCSKQSVGVVIARNGRVLVSGYNGAPAGMAHCEHFCTCDGRDKIGYICGSNPPDGYQEVHLSNCNLRIPCTNAVHAEANAIAYAARWGIRIEGAELFTTFSPCLACGQFIVNAGITKVVYSEYHRDIRGLELCQKAKIEVVHERDMDLIA